MQITSPVKRFPGTVDLPEYLTIPQAVAWEQSTKQASMLRKGGEATDAEYIGAWVPGLLAVVQAWGLEGFSPDPFQSTPRKAVIDLLSWLITEITKLYEDAEEVPNA